MNFTIQIKPNILSNSVTVVAVIDQHRKVTDQWSMEKFEEFALATPVKFKVADCDFEVNPFMRIRIEDYCQTLMEMMGHKFSV